MNIALKKEHVCECSFFLSDRLPVVEMDNRRGIGYWRMSPDDIFASMDPQDLHKKEEAKILWDSIYLEKDGTKQLVHAFDRFMSIDDRFYEMLKRNKERYASEGTNPYPEAVHILNSIESVFRDERQRFHRRPPFETLKSLSKYLIAEEEKENNLQGDALLVSDDFCFTLVQLREYLEKRQLSFY